MGNILVNTGTIEYNHELRQSLLNYDRKRTRRDKRGATVYIKDLAVILRVKFVEDSPAVLSLGTLCAKKGYSYSWKTGEQPSLTP